jgi:hypothetical protein
MTSGDWLTSTDLQAMLAFVQDSGRASERKLRLFAAACCRRVWERLDNRARRVVEAVERLASESELRAASDALIGHGHGHEVARSVAWPDPMGGATRVSLFACIQAAGATRVAMRMSVSRTERAAQADLLRDIFGPFCPLPPLPAFLLVWEDGLIPQMATGIYDNRLLPSGHLDQDRLAVLADALLDAGCDDAELLAHLRSPGPHVKGCAAVDAILGQQ